MNRRDFIKTVASVSAVSLLPITAYGTSAAKAKSPDTDISAPKKKEGFFSTGHAALDEALGGGIPYLSYVTITGGLGNEQAELLNLIHKTNDKDKYAESPKHVLKYDLPAAFVSHNQQAPDGYLGEYMKWSFMQAETLNYLKVSMSIHEPSEIRKYFFHGWTLFEIQKITMSDPSMDQTFFRNQYHNPVMDYADIVIDVDKTNYTILKNKPYYYFNKSVPKG